MCSWPSLQLEKHEHLADDSLLKRFRAEENSLERFEKATWGACSSSPAVASVWPGSATGVAPCRFVPASWDGKVFWG